MQNISFKYNGVTFIVSFTNNKIHIYKLNNGNYIELNAKEKEELDTLLNSQYSYIYDSELLRSLVIKNDKIESKKYLYDFLIWLENIIPLGCRDNFYRNVSTLSTELNLDFDGTGEISSNYGAPAKYDTLNNKIIMEKSELSKIREIANQTTNPDEYYWKEYSQVLLHELSHMASSKYNPDSGVVLCGFDTYPTNELESQNRGLTEGFTEIIACAGIPSRTSEISSGYYIEASIINQLIQVIGNETLLKSYFSNNGITDIKQKLHEFIPDTNKSFQLFRNIELNYQIRHINEEQNVLGSIQSTILDYLEIKLQKLYELGESENIANVLSIYEQLLITPEKLEAMNKKPENFKGLLYSLEKFSGLKDTYLGKSYDSNGNKAK